LLAPIVSEGTDQKKRSGTWIATVGIIRTGAIAAGRVQRASFKRWWAEVCLGKVGAVAAREVSRFARNSRDGQQLIEMCGGRTRRVSLAIRFDNSLLSLAFSKPLLRLASYLFCEIGHPLGCGLAKRLFPW
jgi:hypothetical protein